MDSAWRHGIKSGRVGSGDGFPVNLDYDKSIYYKKGKKKKKGKLLLCFSEYMTAAKNNVNNVDLVWPW